MSVEDYIIFIPEHSVGQIDHILFSINRRDLPTCALRRLVYLPNSYKTLITIDISLKNNQKSSKSVMKNFSFFPSRFSQA